MLFQPFLSPLHAQSTIIVLHAFIAQESVTFITVRASAISSMTNGFVASNASNKMLVATLMTTRESSTILTTLEIATTALFHLLAFGTRIYFEANVAFSNDIAIVATSLASRRFSATARTRPDITTVQRAINETTTFAYLG